MIVPRLFHTLATIDVKRDLRPHCASTEVLDLVWRGPVDRRNGHAPIADLPDGTRFYPTAVIGVLYEIGLRPHLPADGVLSNFLSPSGQLLKFGGSAKPTDIDPRRRRFGTLLGSERSGAAGPRYPSRPLSRRGEGLLRVCARGAKALQATAPFQAYLDLLFPLRDEPCHAE